MNWTKVKHVALISLGLLSAFAGVVYQSTLAGNEVGAGMTFGVLAGLVLVMWSRLEVILGKADAGDVSTITRIFHGAAAVSGLVMPLLVLITSHFTPGSQAFIVAGYAATFLGDLSKTGGVLPVDLGKILSGGKPILEWLLLFLSPTVLVGFTLLTTSPVLAADPTPSDAAPPISFCIGQSFNCVIPDFSLNTVNYDLGAKQWKAGVTSIAVGYAFLYASDQPWSSGLALHGAGSFNQGTPSYFALTPTIVIAKYFEVGASFIFLNGAIEKDLTLGFSFNAEILTTLFTGKNIATRYQARLAAARQPEIRQPEL